MSLWIYYSLCITILTNCGVFYDPTIFDGYVKQFEIESITYNNPQKVTNLIIKFDTENPLPDHLVGQCNAYFGATPTILINHVAWNKLSEDQKEITVFHEMGHCVLGKGHDDTKWSIMNSMLLSGYYSAEDRSALLADFFKK